MSQPIPAWALRAARTHMGIKVDSDMHNPAVITLIGPLAETFAAEFERTGLLKAVEPYLERDRIGTHWEGCHETHSRCALVRAYDKAKEVEK